MEVYGIDFGTTRSTIIKYDTEGREVRKIGEPIRTIAAVSIASGECFYGDAAGEKMTDAQYEFLPSLKDLLSRKYDKEYGNTRVSNLSVIAGFFRYLKTMIEDGTPLNEVVMAIPNDFPVERRVLLRKAAAAAGISVKFFVNEPVAAFYSNFSNQEGFGHAADLRNCNNVAVFDWGGGTLDVTILGCQGARVYEIAKKRMDCAGNAIDERFARCVHARIMEKMGKDVVFEDMATPLQNNVKRMVEGVKINLNSSDPAKNTARFAMMNYGGHGAASLELKKDYFNGCIEYIVDAAIDLLSKTIAESGLGVGGIDKIVLMGGSSKLHLLQQKAREKFGEDKILIPAGDSDWGVAIGAAMLSALPGAFYVNQNVSLRLSDDSEFPLIEKNSEVARYQGEKESFAFGKVDASEKAVFVMTGSKDIDECSDKYLVVKTQKMFNETLTITAFIDENNVVNVEGSCEGLPGETSSWKYANLTCSYQLPLA